MAMAPPALGPEIYGFGFRFTPTPQEAVTYYLPRLVSGDPRALHEAVRPVIHRADVYACDPADLARRFRPMPRTGDRFFFASCKKNRAAAADAGRGGSWNAQSTVEIMDGDGVRVGELKKLRYKKRGVFTDWLMDEYSSCGGAAGGKQFVLCKVYVSPRSAPDSAAHRESAAYFALAPPPPAAPTAFIAQAAAKRAAPPQGAMPPPCTKRMRCPAAAVQPAPPPPPQPPVPQAPPTLPSLTAVRKMMPFAPPQHPSAPRRGSTIPSAAAQPSPASAPSATQPSAPTRLPLVAVRKMSFAPPQPCPPRHGSMTPASSRPPAPAPQAPTRALVQPKQEQEQEQVPLPTPLVVAAAASASHSRMPQRALAPPCPPQVFVQPKQRTAILDPFEAAMLRDEAEEQTVAAAPHPPEAYPAPAAALQEDDDDDDDDNGLAKDLEDAMLAAEDDDDGLLKDLEDAMHGI